VEHDLDAAPVREDGVRARQVMHRVQAALVPVEACAGTGALQTWTA
jgi:hypothetical protein